MWQELFNLAYNYLKKRGLSRSDAEDLAQETLITTYQHLDGIEPTKLRAWVYAVARNKHIDWLRKQNRGGIKLELFELEDAKQDPVGAMMMTVDRVEILRLLSNLPDFDSRLLELKYFEELTLKEIAALTGRPVNTVKIKLFRARNRLRPLLLKGEIQDE